MRRIAAILALVWAAGCGTPEEGTLTLRIVTWRPDAPRAWEALLERFEREHPGIRVEQEIAPNNSTQFHDLLTQRLRNRDASVDAFLMDVIWTAEFARAGWVLPLDDRFPAARRRRFFATAIRPDTVDGRVYAVPLNMDVGVLYYRRDLLERHGLRPPATWSGMLDQIDTVLEGEADPTLHGFSGQLRQYEGLVCNMLEFVHSNGGDLLEPRAPETLEAVAFVRDRILAEAAPRGALTWQEQESLDLFAGGGAVFHRNWPYAWRICETSEVAGRVGIAPLPAFEGGESVSALGGWRFGISAFSDHPREAWELVAFLTGPDAQRTFAVREGKLPARRDLYRDPAVLEANPHFRDLLPVVEAATPRPRTPVYPQVSHILQRFFHAAISDPDSDIAALAGDARQDLDRALRRAR